MNSSHTTASHTMIARTVGHEQERRGFAIMAAAGVLAAILVTAMTWSMWPPRVLDDTARHRAQ